MRRSTSSLLSSGGLALVLALTALVGGAAASSRTAVSDQATGSPAVVTAAAGTLCVTKFNDLDGDGSKDGGEPTLAGWVFTIRSLGGAVLGTITTTSALRTCADVPAATVTVTETQQAGWTPTDPATGSRTVTVTAGQTTTVTFGNRQAASGTLCVVKFNDLNGDGLRSGGEPTLGGWVFTVRDLGGIVVATITTSAFADRACAPVPAGYYNVSETPQAGWTPTSPASGSQTVGIVAGQTATAMFGNRQTPSGTLCIVKFNDLNGDGVRGASEPALSGWVFTVKDPGGIVVGTITTAATGARACIDLPAGAYTVTETAQAGWLPTTPGGGSQTATVVAGQTQTLTFGNRQTPLGTLCVVKFNDLNGNGLREANEPPLGGWEFSIKNANGEVTAVITTSMTDGQYCVGTPPSVRTVIETPKAGWVATAPASGTQTATVVANQTTTITFGNHQTTAAGALILSATSPHMVNNAIRWGEYVDLMTTGPAGTAFSIQVTVDNVTWETLKDSMGSPLSFTIGSTGTSTFRYTPVRNYWYRSLAGSMTSNTPRVTVRQTIALRPMHTGTRMIKRGSMVEFMAIVRPVRPELPKGDAIFELFKLRRDVWVRVQTATEMIDSGGVADWTWDPTSPGRYYVRAQALPTLVNANSFWSPRQFYDVK